MLDKKAWPSDIGGAESELLARLETAPDAATRRELEATLAQLRLGERTLRFGRRLVTGTGQLAVGTGRLVSGLLTPATTVGPPVLKALGAAGRAAVATPFRRALLGAGIVSGPIISSEMPQAANRVTDRILRARQDPRRLIEEREVMASLDTFLEKKAAAAGMNPPDAGMVFRDNAIKGFASGAGSEIAQGLMYGIGRMASGIGGALFGDPRKKELLEKILRTDQILSDALRRNPATREQIMEAYGTLNKFAPTLATDINAVRSFLREVVLGGGHVNYATIKNLIDTEKSLHGDAPKYKGIF